MQHSDCPFCNVSQERVVLATPHGIAIWDLFPVNPGHLLIVPRRHAVTWNDLTDGEKGWTWSALDEAIALIRSRYSPDGFNVGFNLGSAAGQTVPHFHLHVIPRYAGDVDDPRGGVRHVIPSKGNYLTRDTITKLDQQRLIKGGDDPFLPHLILHMDEANRCDIAVAFLLDSGARCIIEHLKDFLGRGGKARILVSDYLDVTEPIALRRLADLEGNLRLKIFEAKTTAFHLKSYTFAKGSNGIAFVGSSNLSEGALTTSLEWNYRVISGQDVDGFLEVREGFEQLFNSRAAVSVSEDWIEQYEQRRSMPKGFWESGIAHEQPLPTVTPHVFQHKALDALVSTRNEGFTAGLVVLATGLGKTWLAAFDSDRPEFRRVLFVAHREEILNQAIEVFRRVRPTARIGRLSGDHRDTKAELIFASVQTLGRLPHLSRFQVEDFDYVVIDEFHHAAAGTYRRVIDFFRPKFLLGLTATPDRTDGADLLSICQENLVYEATIRDGIDSKLLSPFHYFGVPDEIDYSNIPWRNSQFDITELTNATATEARARNALEQLRKHGGQRCIAFCCSQRHADFMAEFSIREGMRAVAVHSGANSAPRATSLERLRDGDLEVIFAVDIFNEGVDVPSIDTVLMLRPTESTIIWLQQIGRGLRISEGKDRLVIIDYIGNHRAFLMKLRGMAVILGLDAESSGRQREALEAIRDNVVTLPARCHVTYETAAVEILQLLLRPTRTEEVLESFYRDFQDRNGIRPTAIETSHAGLNPRSNSDRSWLSFVDRMGGLNADEKAAWSAARDFFVSLEKTEATRSYKIVLLAAMLDGQVLTPDMPIADITRRVADLVKRMHRLADDFSIDVSDTNALQRLLVNNPIEAFVGAKGMGGVPYFRFDSGIFGFAFEIPDLNAFGALLREVIDWRLAQYLARGQVPDVICRVARNSSGQPILSLPSANGSLPKGPLEVEVEGELKEAIIAKIAVEVVRAPDAYENELPNILCSWFGDEAGLPGRADRVRFRRSEGKIVMEPWGQAEASSAAPKLWERYPREAIPPFFGLQFNPAIWNVGFVVSPPNIFLLVTLAKDDMSPDHRYADHFLSEQEFNWQSQNRTTQESRHGQMLHNHRGLGIQVHLFVRGTKKLGQRPAPFVYCGEVDFVSWEGNSPITVRWRLRQAIPRSLRTSLKVPV